MKNRAKERYSRLAPLTLQQRLSIILEALGFFSPLQYKSSCDVLEIQPQSTIQALSVDQFIQYLKKKNILDAERYRLRINEILNQLSKNEILTKQSNAGSIINPGTYLFIRELSSIQREGPFWLVSVLGAEFLHQFMSEFIVQITGFKENEDEHAGTGIVLDSHHILTCAHVLNDMTVNKEQTFQQKAVKVIRQISHPSIDVGIIEVDTSIRPPLGLGYSTPVIGDDVWILGFPVIPMSTAASLTIQKGEITNSIVELFSKQRVFLYSAIARPGNSGGPIISSAGQVVGIVSQDLTYDQSDFSPHFAGVATESIQAALQSLDLDISLPIETYH